MAHNIAPGLLRKDWCHHSWPDFDKQAWRDAVGSAEAACQKSWRGVIAGCDVHEVRALLSCSEYSQGYHRTLRSRKVVAASFETVQDTALAGGPGVGGAEHSQSRRDELCQTAARALR